MQVQFAKQRGRRAPIAAEFTQIGNKIIGSAPWSAPEMAAADRRQERFMVFTVDNDKIVDMQGFISRKDAERFAKR